MTTGTAVRRAGGFDRAIHFLRRADWLTEARARAYGCLLGVAMLVLVLGMVARLGVEWATDPGGRPAVTDFDAFWAGARLAAAGDAPGAYRMSAISAAERQGARIEGNDYLPYLNPPIFLLVTLPLAFLPYLAAMAAFLGAGFAAAAICLKRILPARVPWVPVLAFPGAIMNAIITQNGCVTATCFAGAVLLLESRPLLGGACLGGLVYKPQFAIGVPFVLIAARRWRAVAGCAAAALAGSAVAWMVFGSAAWNAFLRAAPVGRAILDAQPQTWTKLVTVYSAVRLLHGSASLGYALQALAALAAITVLIRTAARRPGAGAEVAALVAATLLCTPYAMDYDLACLGVPLAWLAAEALRTAWRDWEKALLLAAYLLPLGARWLGIHAHLPVVPFALAGLLALLWRRVSQGSVPIQAAAARNPC